MIRGWGSVAAALVAAALVGGVAASGVMTLVLLLLWLLGNGSGAAPQGVFLVLILGGALAAAVFMIGLLVVGAPAWAVMHVRGLRSRKHAVTAGAVLTAGAVFALSALSGPQGAVGGLFAALVMTAPGAAAGWVLHRIAYGV